MYKDEDFITLEVEFKTIEEMEQFKPIIHLLVIGQKITVKKIKNLQKQNFNITYCQLKVLLRL